MYIHLDNLVKGKHRRQIKALAYFLLKSRSIFDNMARLNFESL